MTEEEKKDLKIGLPFMIFFWGLFIAYLFAEPRVSIRPWDVVPGKFGDTRDTIGQSTARERFKDFNEKHGPDPFVPVIFSHAKEAEIMKMYPSGRSSPYRKDSPFQQNENQTWSSTPDY